MGAIREKSYISYNESNKDIIKQDNRRNGHEFVRTSLDSSIKNEIKNTDYNHKSHIVKNYGEPSEQQTHRNQRTTPELNTPRSHGTIPESNAHRSHSTTPETSVHRNYRATSESSNPRKYGSLSEQYSTRNYRATPESNTHRSYSTTIKLQVSRNYNTTSGSPRIENYSTTTKLNVSRNSNSVITQNNTSRNTHQSHQSSFLATRKNYSRVDVNRGNDRLSGSASAANYIATTQNIINNEVKNIGKDSIKQSFNSTIKEGIIKNSLSQTPVAITENEKQLSRKLAVQKGKGVAKNSKTRVAGVTAQYIARQIEMQAGNIGKNGNVGEQVAGQVVKYGAKVPKYAVRTGRYTMRAVKNTRYASKVAKNVISGKMSGKEAKLLLLQNGKNVLKSGAKTSMRTLYRRVEEFQGSDDLGIQTVTKTKNAVIKTGRTLKVTSRSVKKLAKAPEKIKKTLRSIQKTAQRLQQTAKYVSGVVKSLSKVLANPVVIKIALICLLVVMALMIVATAISSIVSLFPTTPISSANPWESYVAKWRPLMTEYCEKHGIPDHVDLMLSIMIEESGGDQDIINIMQVNGTIVSQEDSIDKGCAHFANDLATMKAAGLNDLATAVQSYNYGCDYVNYIASNGGKHTLELSTAFSESKKAQYGYSMYGLPKYADDVLGRCNITDNGDGTYIITLNMGAGAVDGTKTSYFDAMYSVATSYLGCPYVWTATGPSSFDCSGYTQFVFAQVGLSIPRTAQDQYNYFQSNYTIKPLANANPGDIVFFTGTSSHAYISHVGICIGNNQFIHASSGAGSVVISDFDEYYTSHVAGIGSY